MAKNEALNGKQSAGIFLYVDGKPQKILRPPALPPALSRPGAIGLNESDYSASTEKVKAQDDQKSD